MYMYMNMYISCVYTYIHTHVYMYIYIIMYMHVCIHILDSAFMHILDADIFLYICCIFMREYIQFWGLFSDSGEHSLFPSCVQFVLTY